MTAGRRGEEGERERGSEATVHAHLNRIKAAAVPALRAIMLKERKKERAGGEGGESERARAAGE